MPIYEFQCDRCRHVFERLQKLSDPDPDICPECGEQAIRRRLTAPAFRLSGSGWYETDFKKDGDAKRNLTEKSDGGGAESKSQSSSDAKPDATSKADSKLDPKPATSSNTAASAKPAAKPEPKTATAPASKPAAE